MISLTLPYPPTSNHNTTVVTYRVPTDQELIAAYERLGNVHKVAEHFGYRSGGNLHRRLVRLGAAKPMRVLTDEDRARIKAAYEASEGKPLDLAALANELGRCRSFIATAAKKMGLTNMARPMSAAAKAAMSAGLRDHFATNGHPRGFAGHRHSGAAKAAISQKSKDSWLVMKTFAIGNMSPENLQKLSDRTSARMASQPAENAYSRTKSGRRADLDGTFFRSAWEANFARYLNWLKARGEIDAWEYEPETFWFEAIKRGVRSYKPDFRVTEKGRVYFYEVKGWMDDKSKTKLRRMKKYYPAVEVRLFGEKDYRALKAKVSALIPGWE
jgi:hypothetical protein